MATHWKAFLIGWAICLAIYFALPPTTAPVDTITRLAVAVGGTLPVIIFPLVGAGIGRMTRFGTAKGLYNGAALGGVVLALYLVSALQ